MMEKYYFCFTSLTFLKATCKSGSLKYAEHMDEDQRVLTVAFAGSLSAHHS